mmetsp:Transcript_28169/g.40340  ORF Transcript_28169/g.40340 Transcript_28169/m.40340 type:complete len:97 (-) Transcript_28169:810-1100(-)
MGIEKEITAAPSMKSKRSPAPPLKIPKDPVLNVLKTSSKELPIITLSSLIEPKLIKVLVARGCTTLVKAAGSREANTKPETVAIVRNAVCTGLAQG